VVRIAPFRALRYNPEKISFISRVVAPPYDVIGPGEAEALRKKDPHNVIRLILGLSGPAGRGDRHYLAAAETLRAWRRQGVLLLDEPAVYLCEQSFELHGRTFTRRGFSFAMLLEEPATGNVLPHEQTTPGPKADRLRLMKACRACLSQVFGIVADADARVQALAQAAGNDEPLYEFQTPEGVTYRLWKVRDAHTIQAVAAALAQEVLIIADGHHRYETALQLRRELRDPDRPEGTAPEDYVPVFCVSAKDPGLRILPTHRLVRTEHSFDPEDLLAALRDHWAAEEVSVPAPETLQRLAGALEEDRSVLGCYLPSGRLVWLRPRPGRGLEALVPPGPPAWRELPVTRLHYAILSRLFGFPAERPGNTEFLSFTHDPEELYWAVESGRAAAGFILPPLSPGTVVEIARTGTRMPAKSTFFYPKIDAGLLLYPYEDGAVGGPIAAD